MGLDIIQGWAPFLGWEWNGCVWNWYILPKCAYSLKDDFVSHQFWSFFPWILVPLSHFSAYSHWISPSHPQFGPRSMQRLRCIFIAAWWARGVFPWRRFCGLAQGPSFQNPIWGFFEKPPEAKDDRVDTVELWEYSNVEKTMSRIFWGIFWAWKVAKWDL